LPESYKTLKSTAQNSLGQSVGTVVCESVVKSLGIHLATLMETLWSTECSHQLFGHSSMIHVVEHFEGS